MRDSCEVDTTVVAATAATLDVSSRATRYNTWSYAPPRGVMDFPLRTPQDTESSPADDTEALGGPWAAPSIAWAPADPAPDRDDDCCVLRYVPDDPRDATFRPGVGPFLACSVIPRFVYDVRLTPDGPCAVDLPVPTPLWARDVPGWLTVPTDAAVVNVVNWMDYYGVPDAAQRLGVTLGPDIEATAWFTPRQGTWEGGRLRPFPVIVSPDHFRHADALLALHAAWPLTMQAFLAVGDFGPDGVPTGSLSRPKILTCRSELLADAVACFQSQL